MATQLALTEDLAPRKHRPHVVYAKERPTPPPSLPLVYGGKPASVIELVWPVPETPAPTPERKHLTHKCGLYGGHKYACVAAISGRGCSRPEKTPCDECERRVRLSYRAGRYCSR